MDDFPNFLRKASEWKTQSKTNKQNRKQHKKQERHEKKKATIIFMKKGQRKKMS